MFAVNWVFETPVIDTANVSLIDPGGYLGSVCTVLATTTGATVNGEAKVTVTFFGLVGDDPTFATPASSMVISFHNGYSP